MATVPNRGNPSQPVDKSFVVPNRYGVAAPTTPLYAGEIVTGIPVTGASYGGYVATSLDPNSWVSFGVGSSVNSGTGPIY